MGRKSQQDVRQRLLSVGLRLFAEKGYERATVREICDAAQSNLAAINYYFRDKSGYYQEVCAYARSLRMAGLQQLVEASPDGDPWEVLSIHVDTLLNSSYDSELFLSNWLHLREYLNGENNTATAPTPQETDDRKLLEQQVPVLLAKILGEAATEQNIALLTYTYVSMSLFLIIQIKMDQNPQNTLRISQKLERQHLRDHIVDLVRVAADRMKRDYAASRS